MSRFYQRKTSKLINQVIGCICTLVLNWNYNPDQIVQDGGLCEADLDMVPSPPPPPPYNVDEQRQIFVCDIHIHVLMLNIELGAGG